MFSGWDEYHLINAELDRLTRSLPESDLGEVIAYVLSSQGKRVRPLLLIFSAEAYGAAPLRAVNAALAIELVHAASLVHDDILDLGLERRGNPSTLQRYGHDASLLAGDYLISRSIDLISYYPQPVIRSFSGACMSMSEGEMLDLSSACSPDDYYSCISKKTASLFAASAKIGALIAGAPSEEVAKMESYGLHLGLAYQILDDLEEFLGIDQGKVSKKVSVTLPRIFRELYPEDEALKVSLQEVVNHSTLARGALQGSAGSAEVMARLEEIVDQMTSRGLNKCRLLKSLC
ncbi:MAG: polyprenyl synthetase family protein [Methanotrichaceae archaeon]|nr:polyprenyl synthetase family protein [Methanotrichaceae archaeon]